MSRDSASGRASPIASTARLAHVTSTGLQWWLIGRSVRSTGGGHTLNCWRRWGTSLSGSAEVVGSGLKDTGAADELRVVSSSQGSSLRRGDSKTRAYGCGAGGTFIQVGISRA